MKASKFLKSNFLKKIVLLIIIQAVITILSTIYLSTTSTNLKILFGVFNCLPSVLLFCLIYFNIIKPIKIFENQHKLSSSLFRQVNEFIAEQKNELINAGIFAKSIGEGNFETDYNKSNTDSGLGNALTEMRDKLKNVAEDEKNRGWLIAGQAKFSQIMRDNMQTNVADISYLIISNLVKYANCNQGGIYLLNEFDPSDIHIKLNACYAFDRKKYHNQRIELCEGLIGQCIDEKDTIFVTDIPNDYINITSGLGTANPNCILIVPIKRNEKIYGAIELASFSLLNQFNIELIKSVAEDFASTYGSIVSNQEMSKLLHESRDITEVLKSKENELKQNEEELMIAQEFLNQKLIELTSETNLTKSILNAINSSNACIQLDLNGNILDANQMFLSVMGFTMAQIVSKNEKIFLSEEEIISEGYTMMWNSLRGGNFNSGEFKRINKEGKEVWMDVSYNPILDTIGKPFKILMFANFISEKKEAENEFKNKINAINEAFGFLEINNDYSIKSANQYFLDLLQMKRKDLRQKTFFDMLEGPHNNNITLENAKINLEKGTSFKAEISFVDIDGKPLHFVASLSRGRDINGKLSNIYATLFHLKEANFTSMSFN